MQERVYTVQFTWDAEAAVWVAASDDVPGLATRADELDALIDKLKVVIPEALEANRLLPADHPGEIPRSDAYCVPLTPQMALTSPMGILV
jgi:predicted RNase H-like HicB family nuclease